jgi:hypothetical protein
MVWIGCGTLNIVKLMKICHGWHVGLLARARRVPRLLDVLCCTKLLSLPWQSLLLAGR